MSDRLEPMLPETAVLTYFGRDEAASPAVGSKKVSDREEAEILASALEVRAETKTAPAPETPVVAASPAPASPELAKVGAGLGPGRRLIPHSLHFCP